MSIDSLKIDLGSSFITNIIKTKRVGFTDIYGCLSFVDQNNSLRLKLIDSEDFKSQMSLKIILKNNFVTLNYFAKDNMLYDSNHIVVDKFPYLSNHSADSVISILNNYDPSIPTLGSSIDDHILVLSSLNDLLKKTDFQIPLIT